MDRNLVVLAKQTTGTVALRKESVDRNMMWRILYFKCPVALRKESVDRNNGIPVRQRPCLGRSPQGERG